MKTKRIVLPADHFPTRPPTLMTAVAYMGMDIYGAPGWLWGAVGVVLGIVWLGWIVQLFREEVKPLAGYGEQKDKGSSS